MGGNAVGRLCAKKNANAEKLREAGRDVSMSLPLCPAQLRCLSVTISAECNYGAEMTVLNAMRFAHFVR